MKGKSTTNYTKLSDKEVLDTYQDLVNSTKPIPLSLSNEVHKRKLVKSYTGTFNSNM